MGLKIEGNDGDECMYMCGCAIELKLMARHKHVRKNLKFNRVCVWDLIEARGVVECLFG